MIDKETFEPSLENTMYNFMQCSQMMFGTRVRFGISFKANQPGFQIYTRKFFHNYKVAIDNKNHEGAIGCNLSSTKEFVMAEKTVIKVYKQEPIQRVFEWTIPSKGKDNDIEILYLTVSPDEQKIGICLGRVLIKDHKEITEIVIYKRNRQGEFELEKMRDFEFDDTCIQFTFYKNNSNELLFFTKDEIFKFDYMNEGRDKETKYQFANPLADQPTFGVFNSDQTKLIVTSPQDILYVDLQKRLEIDLDDREEISAIQNIITDDTYFYVLANKKESKLGYYLLEVDCRCPDEDSKYLIRWSNKLDIGNCDLHLMTEDIYDKKNKDLVLRRERSIVVSYKCIGINTFNVFVIDLESTLIKYWHEGYQLWESPVKGFLLDNNDFLILSKDGVNMLALGEKPGRAVRDQDGQKRFIHSLGSVNYLKIEPTNHLLFAC